MTELGEEDAKIQAHQEIPWLSFLPFPSWQISFPYALQSLSCSGYEKKTAGFSSSLHRASLRQQKTCTRAQPLPGKSGGNGPFLPHALPEHRNPERLVLPKGVWTGGFPEEMHEWRRPMRTALTWKSKSVSRPKIELALPYAKLATVL